MEMKQKGFQFGLLLTEWCPSVLCPECFPETGMSAHPGPSQGITHSWTWWGQAIPGSSAVSDLGTSRSPHSKKLMPISCGKMAILLLNYPERRRGGAGVMPPASGADDS